MPFAEVGRLGEEQAAEKEGGVRSWVVMPVVWIRKVFVFPTVEAALFRRKDQ